jgi:hypothetical protein
VRRFYFMGDWMQETQRDLYLSGEQQIGLKGLVVYLGQRRQIT